MKRQTSGTEQPWGECSQGARENYEEWEGTVPEVIRADSLWKMAAYRLALLLSDLGWRDVTRLAQDRRLLGLADQLYRALGSIGANLAEGYSRGTGRDRARFYEYALGSAREGRDWYYRARHMLGPEVTEHRLQLATRVIQLVLTMVPQQRGGTLREDTGAYLPDGAGTVSMAWPDDRLLHNIPMPATPVDV